MSIFFGAASAGALPVAGFASLACDGLQLRGCLRVGLCCALRDRLFDPAHELLVGRPEGLPNADRVVDDLDDRRVPVAALAVVEDAVAADEQVVALARRERASDLHLGRSGPRAIDIREVALRHRRERRVLARVVDGEAEVEFAAVEEQRARLEDRALARIEVGEADVVVEQRREVAVQSRELLDARHRVHVGGDREIVRDRGL